MEQQREDIFHTRYHVSNKVCNVIIIRGSCTNVVSIILVKKLGFPMIKYPSLYKLQWLNDSRDVRLNKQLLVSFSIRKNKDEVICDVVPMQVGHILLVRQWKYDQKVIHDGYRNKYSFMKDCRNITLVSFTSKQIYKSIKTNSKCQKKNGRMKKKRGRKE